MSELKLIICRICKKVMELDKRCPCKSTCKRTLYKCHRCGWVNEVIEGMSCHETL